MGKTHVDYQVLPIPPIPNTQALSSSTFKPPPLDGSLNLPEIYEWNAQNNPNHPVFVYPDSSHGGKERLILWAEFNRAIHAVTRKVRKTISSNGDGQSIRTIAILASGDYITYFTTIMGIMRSRNIVFPISTRNSPAAVVHLLEKTGANYLLVGREESHQNLAASSLELLKMAKPKTFPMFAFGDIYNDDMDEDEVVIHKQRPAMEDTAVILHSSGSTAFPKPIPWSHYGMVQQATAFFFGEMDFASMRMACHAVPMFHTMGVLQTCAVAGSGLTIANYEPNSAPSIPTPDNFMRGIIDTKSDLVLAVPSFVEAWSRNEEYVKQMQSMRGVLFSGGPLEKATGDTLRDKGIVLYSVYGCTEAAICCRFLPNKPCDDWEYFAIPKSLDVKLVAHEEGPFEFVIKPSPHHVPFVFNTEIEGERGYSTGDLVIPHPTQPGYYKVFGRLDDQIMHSSGEKTNPGPLEKIINQDPYVQAAVMFGRGRFNAGILVEPIPAEAFDPANHDALSSFRDKIWPTIERMNEYAPQHSRVFKEMILVAKPSKPFTYTAKNTVRRQATINDYADEINELYATVDESMQKDITPPVDWTEENSLAFAREVVGGVLKRELSDEDDLFQHGCDSLQATWIRNSFLNALRTHKSSSSVDVRSIPMNFIYSYPTIASLAKYLSQAAGHGPQLSAEGDAEARVKDMQAMVAKYTASFPTHVPSAEATSVGNGETGAVIVLTGSTGGLGSALLWKLIEAPQVSRVYALNRKGSGTLEERQIAAFKTRGLDTALLSSPKLVLVAADITSERLGLEETEYAKIRDSATHIVHNAYAVNFNMSLSSFEPNILSLKRMMELALASPRASPPRLMFTSSMSTLRNYEGDMYVPEEPVVPTSAIGGGYSESKWVCEEILTIAAQKTALRPIVVRVGQLSGVSTNGYWNPKEWVPSLFKSSVHIGCLPDFNNEISWLPMDVAAQALHEMLDSDNLILHLVHSHPVQWASLFEPAAQILGLRLVSYTEWLEKLEASVSELSSSKDAAENAEENPALRIIDFFRASAPASDDGKSASNGAPSSNGEGEKNASEAMGLKRLSLEKALQVSTTLKTCAPLSVEDMSKWMKCWKMVE